MTHLLHMMCTQNTQFTIILSIVVHRYILSICKLHLSPSVGISFKLTSFKNVFQAHFERVKICACPDLAKFISRKQKLSLAKRKVNLT